MLVVEYKLLSNIVGKITFCACQSIVQQRFMCKMRCEGWAGLRIPKVIKIVRLSAELIKKMKRMKIF